MFIVIGNTLPKILTPLAMLPSGGAERISAARRFLGTTLVCLGSITALTFFLAPVGFAESLRQWVTFAILLTWLGAIIWMNLGGARREA